MNILPKGLFSVKNKTEEGKNDEIAQQNSTIVELIKYEDWGWESARSLDGSDPGLSICIRRIYEEHKKKLRLDSEEQEKARLPYRNKLNELTIEKGKFFNKINEYKCEKIPNKKKEIENCREEIRDFRKNPEQYLGDKIGKASFIIGSIILIFLTIYLFIFYSSASYSAFFKKFSLDELGVANSIFDAQALSKAFKDGTTELILILTIPFVFIALGYLIHKFQEGKDWKKIPKIGVLIFVTFIFDCILAYEITEKIYNIKASNSFQDLKDYNLSFAFHSVNFWLIIFAGFVVYIVWGFVFDFFMESYAKLDKVTVYIKTKQEEIIEKQKELEKLESELQKQIDLSSNNEKEINKMKTTLEHSEFIKPKELEHIIYQFLNGWLRWLTANIQGRESHERQEKAKKIVETFITENIITLNISNLN